MTEIHRSADCGNSPKNQFAQEISIALVAGDVEFLTAGLAEDATWRVVGSETAAGLPAVLAAAAARSRPETITIHHVMTHGKVGAVNGTAAYPDGDMQEFCDVIEFTSARAVQVGSVVTYRIKA